MPSAPTATTSPRPAVRPRPAWLQALGRQAPPAAITIDDEEFRLVDLFKHDSWAATGLYRSASGTSRIVKFHRQAPLFGLPMRWLGRLAARHESALLGRLGDLDGIPRLAGPVFQEGRLLRNAVAREFLAGHPLAKHEPVRDAFFPALRDLLAAMHARRIAYVDLHKRENVIVGAEGRPYLIDFQISLAWPRWLPARPLFEIFRKSDEYHLMKHWTSCRPDQCRTTAAELRRPWWINVHRGVAQPFREARRRLLVRVGVRSGKGRVESEAFAEEALRHP